MSKNFNCSLPCGISNSPDMSKIIVHGAKEHNLKNICFELPKGMLIALTGPSGSGKSSIATDILQKECLRQFLESLGLITDHIEKAKVDCIMGLSPSIGVTQRVTNFNPRSTVGTKTGLLTILRNMFATMGHQLCSSCQQKVTYPLQAESHLTTIEFEEKTKSGSKKRQKSYFDCPYCNHQLEKLTLSHFSFNSKEGACQTCKGLGELIDIDLQRLLQEDKTIQAGGINYWNESTARYYETVLLAASKHYNFAFDSQLPLKDYTLNQKNFLLYGINFPDFVKAYGHIKPPKKVSKGYFIGIIPTLLELYKQNQTNTSNTIKHYITHKSCTECNNTRLSRLARETTINDKTIGDITAQSLSDLLPWLQNLKSLIRKEEFDIVTALSSALEGRIKNLIEVGLHYLSLDRSLTSLSAGESQRVRLANLLGSGLTGVLYVLDEPTTGLHPHDTHKLIQTLRALRDSGNTVLIIEHDIDVIKHADYILDIGPQGGSKGGKIVAFGTFRDIMACSTSITGRYLSQYSNISTKVIPYHNEALIIHGAAEHNLQNIDVSIPLQQFVVLTGVSGSGKSTFLFDIVDRLARKYFYNANEKPGKYMSVEGLEHFNRVITIDQTTIKNTKSSRSNVATYTKLFDLIRDLFAALPAAKMRGLGADKFSFNTSDERCQNCNGAGVVEVNMTFMPDIEQECPVCTGMRFNQTILTVEFQGHTIAEILNMTINDALIVFKQERKISSLLNIMKQVGLEYLKIGQSTSTLSGGEAQRIKLASELSKIENGKTLYLLDEPTTGLHPHEVEQLLDILKGLVSRGNTVITIEHNLDVICKADTIIDFGPGGGSAGGQIVAVGTPQEIMNLHNSLTGKALKAYVKSS